ncbi:DotH/IcmK family type IV secretion protein [Brucella sp. HL-2]|nr:DotH/IcmK family type IV secretion protein [Brucella sp. HL-2]MCV9909546.1 DotH/IcmK family type IV secretion protein [Brucella sp. HL-2]
MISLSFKKMSVITASFLAISASGVANAQNTNQGQPPQANPRPVTAGDIDKLRGLLVEQSGAAVLERGDIGSLRDRSLDSQYANTRPGYSNRGQPMPRKRKLTVPLVQNEGAPARLYLGQGIVSAISFFDSRGRPWPIEEVNYDPQMMMINGNGCGETQAAAEAEKGADRPHVLYAMPCKFWSWTNVVVKLEKAPAPFIYQIESGSDQQQSVVDMAVDIMVGGKSPAGRNVVPLASAAGAKPRSLTISESFTPDKALDDFLAAVPPQGARQVAISGDPETDAWIYQGMLYVRSPGVVTNPAQDAQAGPINGAYVWRFDRPVPRVLIKTSNGAERFLSVDY